MSYLQIDTITDLPNEIWVNLFSDKYKLSNLGRVKIYSEYKPVALSTPSTDNSGYLIIGFRINNKSVHHRVHRIVAQHFIENPDNLPVVHHKNGIKNDNRLENLEWCTHKHNLNSARKGKPGVLGEKHPFAKFTNKQVMEIFNSNKTGVELAKEFNVTTISISYIKTGKSWSHVTHKKYVKEDRHWIEYNNKRMTLSDWARLFKVSNTSLYRKIKRSKSFKEVYDFYIKNKKQ